MVIPLVMGKCKVKSTGPTTNPIDKGDALSPRRTQMCRNFVMVVVACSIDDACVDLPSFLLGLFLMEVGAYARFSTPTIATGTPRELLMGMDGST